MIDSVASEARVSDSAHCATNDFKRAAQASAVNIDEANAADTVVSVLDPVIVYIACAGIVGSLNPVFGVVAGTDVSFRHPVISSIAGITLVFRFTSNAT
jgi:hypothetical protein